MREENIGKWKLLIEPEETKKAYSKIRYGNPEGCSCLGCKNYLLVKDVYYSKEAIEIFSKLGIIPLRESELYGTFFQTVQDKELYLYFGWAHFFGKIISAPEPEFVDLDSNRKQEKLIWFEVSQLFSVSIRDVVHLPFSPFQLTSKSILQLEFSVYLPWVLSEKPS